MRPNYLERERKATRWAEIVAPVAAAQVSGALRRAFDIPEQIDDEWERLLARIR